MMGGLKARRRVVLIPADFMGTSRLVRLPFATYRRRGGFGLSACWSERSRDCNGDQIRRSGALASTTVNEYDPLFEVTTPQKAIPKPTRLLFVHTYAILSCSRFCRHVFFGDLSLRVCICCYDDVHDRLDRRHDLARGRSVAEQRRHRDREHH